MSLGNHNSDDDETGGNGLGIIWPIVRVVGTSIGPDRIEQSLSELTAKPYPGQHPREQERHDTDTAGEDYGHGWEHHGPKRQGERPDEAQRSEQGNQPVQE